MSTNIEDYLRRGASTRFYEPRPNSELAENHAPETEEYLRREPDLCTVDSCTLNMSLTYAILVGHWLPFSLRREQERLNAAAPNPTRLHELDEEGQRAYFEQNRQTLVRDAREVYAIPVENQLWEFVAVWTSFNRALTVEELTFRGRWMTTMLVPASEIVWVANIVNANGWKEETHYSALQGRSSKDVSFSYSRTGIPPSLNRDMAFIQARIQKTSEWYTMRHEYDEIDMDDHHSHKEKELKFIGLSKSMVKDDPADGVQYN
jgi:hypothetical protein